VTVAELRALLEHARGEALVMVRGPIGWEPAAVELSRLEVRIVPEGEVLAWLRGIPGGVDLEGLEDLEPGRFDPATGYRRG
jgi:hypothetical protein